MRVSHFRRGLWLIENVRDLNGMQIGQQIVQLLVVENARKRGHHVLAVENSATDLRIRCRSTAGKMRLMKQPPQTGPHQFLIAVGIVTGRTIALEDRLSLNLFRRQLAGRFRRRMEATQQKYNRRAADHRQENLSFQVLVPS